MRSNEEKCLFGQYGVFICSTLSGHRKNKIARHLIAILVSSFYNSSIGCCRLRDQQKIGRQFDACVCKKALVRRCVPREAARLLCLYTRTQRSRFVLNGTIKLFKENADERASGLGQRQSRANRIRPTRVGVCHLCLTVTKVRWQTDNVQHTSLVTTPPFQCFSWRLMSFWIFPQQLSVSEPKMDTTRATWRRSLFFFSPVAT